MLLTIIVFILVLGLLVFAHELGHFVMAKRAGVKVEEFGFGLPPRLFGVKKGETIYSLNLLPIGGFVKIYGEDGGGRQDKHSFASKSIFKRSQILTAGVLMNLMLAILLLSLGYWLGLPAMVEEGQLGIFKNAQIQILQVADNSPAQSSGIKLGDTIKGFRFNDSEFNFSEVSQVQNFINSHQGQEITIIIQRGNEILNKKVVPRLNPPPDQGALGIALAKTALISYPWYRAIAKGIINTFGLVWLILITLFSVLKGLIMTGRLAVDLAGPVGIYSLTGQFAQLGFVYVLQFTALLSINLAILNILPFPALDGGRLLFLLIEKIKGSPINQKTEKIVHTAGFVILILLMLAITWRDIAKFF